jgi:hypothetical protein
VAVGSNSTGPAPHIHLPELAGDRNAVKVVSPIPFSRSSPGASRGCEITGTIVRVIRFQFSVSEKGQTGWMLRTFWVFSSGPKLKLVLF